MTEAKTYTNKTALADVITLIEENEIEAPEGLMDKLGTMLESASKPRKKTESPVAKYNEADGRIVLNYLRETDGDATAADLIGVINKSDRDVQAPPVNTPQKVAKIVNPLVESGEVFKRLEGGKTVYTTNQERHEEAQRAAEEKKAERARKKAEKAAKEADGE